VHQVPLDAACVIYLVTSTKLDGDDDTVDGKVLQVLNSTRVEGMYGQSLRSPPCARKRRKPHPRSAISVLHSTDGFRAHGNLTPSVDGGSLQRKCFIVGVLNFALFNNEEERTGGSSEVLSGARGGQMMFPCLRCPAATAESTPFSPLRVGFEQHDARRRFHFNDIHAPGRPSAGPPSPRHHPRATQTLRPAWIPSRNTSTAMLRASRSRKR
jgi:hypothetical protein